MKEKEKDKKTGLPDFLRYRSNNLSGNEKNSFERELQKDPFAAEAEEGFSTVDPALLAKDMAELQKRVEQATGKRRNLFWYRIAASFAVLMVIATVFIALYKSDRRDIVADSEKSGTIFDINKPEAIVEKPTLPSVAENRQLIQEERIEAKAEKELPAAGTVMTKKAAIIAADSIIEMADDYISAGEEQAKAETRQIAAVAPAAARSSERSKDSRMVRGKVISSEDNLPVPGAIISVPGTTIATVTDAGGNFALSVPEKANTDLVASFIGMKTKEFDTSEDTIVSVTMEPDLTSLDEVVVMGYGIKRSNSVTGAADAGKINVNDAEYTYTAAEPSVGRNEFNKYIEKNIIRPVQQGSQKAVVVLSFVVRLDGKPTGIKVLRSPGKQFSDEATRLLLEGPAWKPASENGVNIEDEVRVRIVFK